MTSTDRLGYKKGNVSDEYNRPTPAMGATFVGCFQQWAENKISHKPLKYFWQLDSS